ncbi:hypothetical protein DENSPDRAFT_843949 [Dentipellis sp. KUC8613]|nr:hypothetical protein DENSPDRAFT_843949 [Dentipellis sp. KUC8613]
MATLAPPAAVCKRPPVDPPPARYRRRASKARKSSRSASPPRKSLIPSVKEQLEEKYRKDAEFWATLSKERQELERWTEERRRNREAAEEYARLCRVYVDSVDGLAQDFKEYEESIARTAKLTEKVEEMNKETEEMNKKTKQLNAKTAQQNEATAQRIKAWGQYLDAWGQANRDHKESNDRCARLNHENSQRLDQRRQELDEEKRITHEYTTQVYNLGHRVNAYCEGVRQIRRDVRKLGDDLRRRHS